MLFIASINSAYGGSIPGESAQGGSIKVWVRLKDKGAAVSAPAGTRAYEDAPVNDAYVKTLEARGFKAAARLKWQNLVSGTVDANALGALRSLPFVAGVEAMPRKAAAPKLPFGPPWKPFGFKRAADTLDYGAAKGLMDTLRIAQVHDWLASQAMNPGKGLRIAVIDDGFHLGSPIFAAIRNDGRIKDQWDFVANKPNPVTDSLNDSHGAECLSLIGGNLPGTLVGIAPQAQFLLYRSEDDDNERYVEEDYVAAAIERAVDSGASVISISLGYRYEYTDGSPDLLYSSLDGRHRPSSLAALGAARRNVLVSVAMGNLPDTTPVLPSLTAPADADSILSAGIVDRDRMHCSYSCTGPTADGRVKPELVSMGIGAGCVVSVANPQSAQASVFGNAGTSFAAPVLAGIAALLRQAAPAATAEDIRQAMIRSGDRYRTPDSMVGYGLVDAYTALGRSGAGLSPFSVTKRQAMYHPGGTGPMILHWDARLSAPNMQLVEINGRNIQVTVSSAGTELLVTPVHPLQTGVYIAHLR